MLGPIVALLLLTSPAAGPVDQLCFSFDLEALRTCQQQQRQQAQIDEQQTRLERLERQQPPALTLPSTTPSYNSPALTLPGLFPDSSPSSSGGSCALCTAAGFR